MLEHFCPPDSGGTAALLLKLRDSQEGRMEGGRAGEEKRWEKQQELVKETDDKGWKSGYLSVHGYPNR